MYNVIQNLRSRYVRVYGKKIKNKHIIVYYFQTRNCIPIYILYMYSLYYVYKTHPGTVEAGKKSND